MPHVCLKTNDDSLIVVGATSDVLNLDAPLKNMQKVPQIWKATY